jgi:hypothetical protein
MCSQDACVLEELPRLAYIKIRNGGEEGITVASRINECGYDRREHDVLCI